MAEDPTLILRKQISIKGVIQIDSDKITMGEVTFPITTKSTYKNTRNQQYSLASICYLHLTRSLDHGEYISSCKASNIEPVSYLDRERILEDLLAPLPQTKITLMRKTRTHPIDISKILDAYAELKAIQPTGVQYILLPRDDASIRAILFEKHIKNDRKNIVEYGKHKFKLINDPEDVESIDRIAAVFLDGSTWQFNGWPATLTARMSHIPIFFLLPSNTLTPPVLSFSATILREDVPGDDSNRASVAFWSIMGVPSAEQE
ncbi:hypothetical protein NEAUS04_1210 [Nematocida ausubeli]|uniref:Paf1 complex subunit Cdc73 N-terminal domain-containing protein n=1 Tax=Nematocida ausubeli (strain ATCC PRA-371 / ERTm2) TaxID=1913371 RepID=A0A086J4Z6_NEMA1|nr:uncharacterized protein NESG_00291 [Nematocida ausubeli]KAI5134554.1 hypothetical protein NEAUS07_0863 [Nematocida ausubeli]KAI5147687.1 hypothetical protein NEAUS05_0976 [Nematocida ausubeli]KAI5162877.1 hypothetical protein NEAUS04_1210 [Nematocida ausubeli]KFG27214.1 hypothetical protein NESG_00291 [Nematocida ausubeli]